MKKTYTLLFLCFIVLSSFTTGGEDPPRPIHIDAYEPTLNLKYVGIQDTMSWFYQENAKAKPKLLRNKVTSNIAVYDIAQNTINYIFKDTEVRQLVAFFYESQYQTQEQSIVFNEDYDDEYHYYGNQSRVVNDQRIPNRALSPNLILVTKDPATSLKTVWICDKHGNNLSKMLEYDESWDPEIDVRNQHYRITRIADLKLEVKYIKY
jgi:hypothetical protein